MSRRADVPGISRHKNRWRARLSVGKHGYIHIGLYPTPEEAESASLTARALIGRENVQRSERLSLDQVIRIIMKVKKISRKELLLRSKIPPSTLSTILRGVHKPGLVTLSRLSRGLGVSLGRVANSWRAG
jgi:hypothetical protein